MASVIVAHRIFRLTGVPTLPWEIDQWPEDWLDAMFAYDVKIPEWRSKLNRG